MGSRDGDNSQDVQQVWVHCNGKTELADTLTCCRGSQRPKRVPNVCDKEGARKWGLALQGHIPVAPAPYGPGDWEEFCNDAGAFLNASLVAKARKNAKEAETGSASTREPPIFVTDSHKLCQASTNILFKHALSEIGKLRDSQLLPVVLSSDFGFLCGVLVEGAPIDVHDSMLLGGGAPRPRGGRAGAQPGPRQVEVLPGVRLQHFSVGEGAADDENGMRDPGLFGSRCIALFADGQCAYSALSPDGTRAVEARGVWQVINGHVVLGGAEGHLAVSHIHFSKQGVAALKATSYEEQIHLALEELEAAFEAPQDLAECIPRGGERLRLMLLESQPRSAEDPGDAESPAAPSKVDLDATFNTAWDTTFGSSMLNGGASVAASESFMRTPVHALLSLAHPAEQEPFSRGRPELKPRLVGLKRGMTPSQTQGTMHRAASAEAPARPFGASSSGDSMMQKLSHYASSSAFRPRDAAGPFPTCPLQPGTYTCEVAEGRQATRSLELVLRPSGFCDYSELAAAGTIRSMPGTAVWRVAGDTLVLDSLGGGASRGFTLRLQRGNRSVEHQVGQVHLSLDSLLAQCKHEPFPQQLDPFPGHRPADASQRIFGLVDPNSPVLTGMKCRPDRLPYHGFEDALRRHGLPCDEILSDFRFIDRDSDGQLSLAEMRTLEKYGTPVASPELLTDFCEAVLFRYATLAEAFAAMQESAGGSGGVSLPDFEKFLTEAAAARPPSGAKKGAEAEFRKLADWVEKTGPEDREMVFTSLNPNGSESIEVADFMSLHLHTAVLAARRLEHFQTWLYEHFGKSEEVFRQIFTTLDVEKSGILTRQAFVDGAKTLGYPCGEKATRSMFSLLDRNFDGKVSLKDFQKLREFDSESLLKDLDALKRMADTKFGGIDACYKKFLDREKKISGSSSMPKVASFEAVQKTCSLASFNKTAPNADLKLVFLFLSEAHGKQANSTLAHSDWALLKGFDSSCLTGSPARLRRILEEKYGGLDEAFTRMHSSWLKRALVKGLKQTAIAGLAHALCEESLQNFERKRGGQEKAATKKGPRPPLVPQRQSSHAEIRRPVSVATPKSPAVAAQSPTSGVANGRAAFASAMSIHSATSSRSGSKSSLLDQSLAAGRRHRLVGMLGSPTRGNSGQVSAVNWFQQ